MKLKIITLIAILSTLPAQGMDKLKDFLAKNNLVLACGAAAATAVTGGIYVKKLMRQAINDDIDCEISCALAQREMEGEAQREMEGEQLEDSRKLAEQRRAKRKSLCTAVASWKKDSVEVKPLLPPMMWTIVAQYLFHQPITIDISETFRKSLIGIHSTTENAVQVIRRNNIKIHSIKAWDNDPKIELNVLLTKPDVSTPAIDFLGRHYSYFKLIGTIEKDTFKIKSNKGCHAPILMSPGNRSIGVTIDDSNKFPNAILSTVPHAQHTIAISDQLSSSTKEIESRQFLTMLGLPNNVLEINTINPVSSSNKGDSKSNTNGAS